MSYVDAGYAICLSVLFCYAVSLLLRRRRLERAAALGTRPGGAGAGSGSGSPGATVATTGARDRPGDRPGDRPHRRRPLRASDRRRRPGGRPAACAARGASGLRAAMTDTSLGSGEGSPAPPRPSATNAEERTAEGANDPAGRRGRRPPRRRLRLWLMAAVLAAALVFLLVEGLGSSLDYFDTVGQALAHKSALGTSTVRLEGTVVPGSIRATAQGATFTIAGAPVAGGPVSGVGRSVLVQNTGSPPALFQPDIPVVVVGHFVSTGSSRFVSDQIMVKHSAAYVAAHPEQGEGGERVGSLTSAGDRSGRAT